MLDHTNSPEDTDELDGTTVALAPIFTAVALATGPVAKLKALKDEATKLATPIRHGMLDYYEVEQRLIDLAETHGLVAETTLGAIELLVANALKSPPFSVDQACAEESPPPAGPEDYGLSAEASEAPPIVPLVLADPSDWDDRTPEPRRWLVHERLPAGAVCLLQGDGAAGKTTIALQLLVATVRGTDWLGAVVDTAGPAIFFSAEEDQDEIHRRLDRIIKHVGLKFSDLKGLHLCCMPGAEAVLGGGGRDGMVRSTSLLDRLEAAAAEIKPKLIVIEAAADVFAGNENDRSQVRQFIGLLRKLAIASGATVLLLAHPSLSGLASGTGTSGSTGWNNSVRARLYFSHVRRRKADDDAEEADSDLRQLQVMKSNYGPAGEAIKLRWQQGVFVPDGGVPSAERMAAEAEVDALFLKLLDEFIATGRPARPSESRSGAPQQFSSHPSALERRVSTKAFKLSMERLLSAGRIAIVTSGSPSKQTKTLVRARSASEPPAEVG